MWQIYLPLLPTEYIHFMTLINPKEKTDLLKIILIKLNAEACPAHSMRRPVSELSCDVMPKADNLTCSDRSPL